MDSALANLLPPAVGKVEHAMEMFGNVRTDNYYCDAA
ncbi:hypothetical protein TIFTF001_021811 [Ficus carica]|uniref:Uncharacterized protein n=1 Tax=Ficus carica TaxID=3494 RepID=A0AA88AB86_FICCA|nr:hypothetical protein TIFTF001_021811 [Ficus carica]